MHALNKQSRPSTVFVVRETRIQQTRYDDDVNGNDLKVVNDLSVLSLVAAERIRRRADHLSRVLEADTDNRCNHDSSYPFIV